MKKTGYIVLLICLLTTPYLQAKEISGVNITESAVLADKKLILNGAGIRDKFVFDIYIGALYLPQKASTAKAVLNMKGPKRILMHFLYDEVKKDSLTSAWTDGFENNLSTEEFKAVKPRLIKFNQLFQTVRKGNEIQLDYEPNKGTHVIINKNKLGTIPGSDFHKALLLVWLGEDPADEELKTGMLGQQVED